MDKEGFCIHTTAMEPFVLMYRVQVCMHCRRGYQPLTHKTSLNPTLQAEHNPASSMRHPIDCSKPAGIAEVPASAPKHKGLNILTTGLCRPRRGHCRDRMEPGTHGDQGQRASGPTLRPTEHLGAGVGRTGPNVRATGRPDGGEAEGTAC